MKKYMTKKKRFNSNSKRNFKKKKSVKIPNKIPKSISIIDNISLSISLQLNGNNAKQQNEMRKLKKKLIAHPIINESLELKVHYLNGLALMMNIDDNMYKLEKSLLIALIDVFQLPCLSLEYFLAFAKKPEHNQIVEMLQTLKERNFIKSCFIVDCLIMANRDFVYKKEEKKLINKFADAFEFNNNEVNRLLEISKEVSEKFKYTRRIKKFLSNEETIGDYDE